MGKRELLLVVGFLLAGIIVYQATAPPPGPDERGLSIGRLVEAARRHVSGNRSMVELTTTTTHKLSSELTELRITGTIAELDVEGEDRADVESTLYVNSRAYNDAEARQYAQQSRLLADQTASALILRMDFPTPGRQRSTVKLKVPKRLLVRVEPGSGRLGVTNVAAVEIAGTRGEAKLRQIAGRVEVAHRGGEVTIEDVGSLVFNGRSGELKLTGVRGDTTIKMDGGGDITASRLAGGLDVEGRNTTITLEDLQPTRGPIRVNAVGGEVTMKGLKSNARIDVRNAELRLAMVGPAQVAIYNEGETIALTPPPGGFNIDALVIDGRVTPDNRIAELGLTLTRADSDKESRLVGAVKGGGPTITVRSTRGDLALQARDVEKPREGETARDEKPKEDRSK